MRKGLGLTALAAWAWLFPGQTLAQGQREPHAQASRDSAASSGVTERTLLPPRALAAWLEDADTLASGSLNVGLSIGRWSSLDGEETDGPVFDVAVGLGPRIQLSASIPYYRASYAGGFQSHGLGETYLAAKVQLLDAGRAVIGVAVSPMLEILSEAAVSDPTLGLSRVNWALPISIQVGSDRIRAYATVGYSSRGAVGGGVAIEQAVFSRLTLVNTLRYSYSTRAMAASEPIGLSRSRTDATTGVFIRAGPAVTLFASAGRTISKMDHNGARLIASAGVSVVVRRHAARR